MNRLLLALVLLGSLLGGCNSPTLVDTPQERNIRIAMECDIKFKELVDDWDFFWLADNECRLTQWHPRVGA